MIRIILLIAVLLFTTSAFAAPIDSGKKIAVVITMVNQDAVKRLNVKCRNKYKHVPAASADLTPNEIAQLSAHPEVVSVELDKKVQAFSDGANHWYGTEAAREDFSVDGDGDGNVSSYTKSDNTIAVIDTGIDASHVDLKGKVIGWNDIVNKKTEPYDDHGHGTHCAGIAAGAGLGNAAYTGVAPGSALVGVKVLDKNGSGYTSDIIAGVDWVISNKEKYGIRVISMSLGSVGSSNGQDASSLAINRAFDAGIVPVVAAGNSGSGPKTIGSPAAAAKAITVGAMADPSSGGFNLAYFSSRGTTADGRIKPDVVAPGYQIMAPKANTGNGYIAYSGTSMATPFVAGTAALMIDATPSITPLQVAHQMESTTDEWGPSGKDVDYGAGNLNAYKAIESISNFTGGNGAPKLPQHIYKEGTIATTKGKQDTKLSVKAGDNVAITLIMPTWNALPDLDVYLLDPQGRTVAYSLGTKRQETINHKATLTGEYTVSVRADVGTGKYFYDASVG